MRHGLQGQESKEAMEIETFYLSSMSIAATLLSILLIIWVAMTVWLFLRARKIFNKLDKLTDTTSDIALHVNELILTGAQRIIAIEKAFLPAQGMKNFAYLFATMFINKKVYKKGTAKETE